MYLETKRGGEVGQPSLQGFIAWLETQDPEQQYQWSCSGECACAQYARHLGVKSWGDVWNPYRIIWSELNSIAYLVQPRTFGNLLKYAKTVKQT
jgi:hypothetical protein